MTVALPNLNALPVRTWNRLKINETSFDEPVPRIEPLEASPVPRLPEGILLMEQIPHGLSNMETSAGQNAREFVCQWANAGFALSARQNGGAFKPVVMHYLFNKNQPAVVDNNAILAEAGSTITLVQIYESEDAQSHFHAGLTRIVAKAGSHVKLVQVQLLNDACAHWNDVGVVAEEGADVEVVQIELGARRALSGCKALLRGAKSKITAKAFYFGSGARSLDFNYVAKHLGPETESEIAASGALFESCQKTCRSTIEFVGGAARSVGHEGENTLLFSPHSVNRSAPLILCGEENVEGQHAATIGKLDADLLFYLNSRGISEAQAKHLMVRAQLAVVLRSVPGEELAQRIENALAERMARL